MRFTESWVWSGFSEFCDMSVTYFCKLPYDLIDFSYLTSSKEDYYATLVDF